MPGALKNALDWLVGSGELFGKPVVILSVSPSAERGHHARAWVDQVVRMQGGDVRDSFTVAVRAGNGDDPATRTERARHRILDALTASSAR
jgi:NAD(P)H-dependent FMN reductase